MRLFDRLVRWMDGGVPVDAAPVVTSLRIEWRRNLGFLAIHLLCLLVFIVGFSWTAFWVAVGLYLVRMFAITGFYHRYFSHRAFRTSRGFQFVMALVGCSAVQRGPLWWAAHHRHHHAHTDDPEDLHSPRQRGFWMSHTGWFLTDAGSKTYAHYVRDLARTRNSSGSIASTAWFRSAMLLLLYGAGEALKARQPALGTNGPQLVVWGFFLSTVVLYHATYTINSLSHMIGSRRYDTRDDSRNNWILAILTLGEGWHNNHHHYSGTVRQGFFWWEYDPTYWGLLVLSWLGLVKDLKRLPDAVRDSNRIPRKRGRRDEIPGNFSLPVRGGCGEVRHHRIRDFRAHRRLPALPGARGDALRGE